MICVIMQRMQHLHNNGVAMDLLNMLLPVIHSFTHSCYCSVLGGPITPTELSYAFHPSLQRQCSTSASLRNSLVHAMCMLQCTWRRLIEAYSVCVHTMQIVAYDFGCKNNILRRLASFGCKVTVVPADYPAKKVMELNPDGIFLSNGPVRRQPYSVHVCSMEQLLHVPCIEHQSHASLGAFSAYAFVTRQVDGLPSHTPHPDWQ